MARIGISYTTEIALSKTSFEYTSISQSLKRTRNQINEAWNTVFASKCLDAWNCMIRCMDRMERKSKNSQYLRFQIRGGPCIIHQENKSGCPVSKNLEKTKENNYGSC